jgi:hypothetical protein
MATSTKIAPHGGYEKSDASPRGLLYFALLMAAILAATALSLIWLFKYFQKTENPGAFIAAPFAAARPLPPPPRIQPNPGADMQNYYQSQQNILNTYGWIDRQNGTVRLPIDRAMNLLLERGLPTRPTATPKNGAPPQKGNRAARYSEQGGSAR